MADYIDRQAAIDAVRGRFSMPVDNLIVEVIGALPSVEAEPVKHGYLEWRKEKTVWQTGYYCSECQAFFGKDYDMVQYFKYCPNCGAKMEGARE